MRASIDETTNRAQNNTQFSKPNMMSKSIVKGSPLIGDFDTSPKNISLNN